MSTCNLKTKEKGDTMTNKNCLEGIRCPQCGHEDAFRIEAQITVYVTDDGTEDEGGHYAWDGESPCRCAECGHAGKIADFRIENEKAEQHTAGPWHYTYAPYTTQDGKELPAFEIHGGGEKVMRDNRGSAL